MKENTAEVKNLNVLNQALTIKLTFSTIKKTPKWNSWCELLSAKNLTMYLAITAL